MKHELCQVDEKILVGVMVPTHSETELDAETSKITRLATHYFEANLAEKIQHRANPSVTIAAYTDYSHDYQGKYNYFIGEEVTSEEGQDLSQFKIIKIPAGKYLKITTPKGKIPDILARAWQAIWSMSPEELGGERTYKVDFEIYDERAADLNNAEVDIYVGLEA